MILNQLAAAAQYEHNRQVAKISGLLAEKAGYAPAEVDLITQAAVFHDVGKNAVPKEILDKPAALTPEEYEIVKTHASAGGAQIEEAAGIMQAAAVMCRQHHERPDARGYFGLSGESIHPHARLIAVADVYDALSARRPYKSPWDQRRICAYFTEQAGKQFDPFFVRLLLESLGAVRALYEKETPTGG